MAPVASWGGKKNLALPLCFKSNFSSGTFPQRGTYLSGQAEVLLQPYSPYGKASQKRRNCHQQVLTIPGQKVEEEKKPNPNKTQQTHTKNRWIWQKRLLMTLGNTSWSPFPSLIQPFYTLYLFQRKKKSTLILAPLMKPKHPFPLTPQIQMIIPSSATSYINHCSRQFRLSLQTKPILPEIACSSINFSCVVYNMLTPPRIASTSHLPRDKALQPLLPLNTRALRIY